MPNILEKIKYLFSYFLSPREILLVCLFLFISFFFFLEFLYRGSAYFMVERVMYAGNVTEGVLGKPKEPNPYSAVIQPDKDLTRLLYGSLLKEVPEENFKSKYELLLAESVDVSNDKNTYKVVLRKNIYFSNGDPITLTDVVYSLQNVPLEKDYIVETQGQDTLLFKLKKIDNNFLRHLTFPILKKDSVFESSITTDLVTSGPFKIKSIEKDSDANITEIVLERFANGQAKLPYLKTYTLRYFKDEVDAYSAFQRKEIDLLSGIPGTTISKIADDTNIKFSTSEMPNNFAVFFNQNESEDLRESALRQAMSDIVDRESLTNQILGKFGRPQKNILGEQGSAKNPSEIVDNLGPGFYLENGVLYRGTKKSTETNKVGIKIKLTTIDNPELVETAKFLQTAWKKIGIETDIQIIDRKELNNIVKERDFEALLFGFSIKSEKDYYSFFSSKERTYPKLNISNYTSKQTDKILNVLSGDNSDARVRDLLNQLSLEIEADNPIILLYKPQFVFAHFLNTKIKLPNTIKSEEDRYIYVENWYTRTEKVWNFLSQSKTVDKIDSFLY